MNPVEWASNRVRQRLSNHQAPARGYYPTPKRRRGVFVRGGPGAPGSFALRARFRNPPTNLTPSRAGRTPLGASTQLTRWGLLGAMGKLVWPRIPEPPTTGKPELAHGTHRVTSVGALESALTSRGRRAIVPNGAANNSKKHRQSRRVESNTAPKRCLRSSRKRATFQLGVCVHRGCPGCHCGRVLRPVVPISGRGLPRHGCVRAVPRDVQRGLLLDRRRWQCRTRSAP